MKNRFKFGFRMILARGYARDRSALLAQLFSKNVQWSGYQNYKKEILEMIAKIDELTLKLYE